MSLKLFVYLDVDMLINILKLNVDIYHTISYLIISPIGILPLPNGFFVSNLVWHI